MLNDEPASVLTSMREMTGASRAASLGLTANRDLMYLALLRAYI